MAINFKLVSEFQTIHRRSFVISPTAILNPNNAQPLVDGEWLALGDAINGLGDYQMGRDSVTPSIVPSYCYFGEQGRYETQAIGKGPVLFMGEYEADTLIMDPTNVLVGSALEVANVTIGGIVRRALQLTNTGYTVARCTRLPGNNNGFLRFRSVNG